MMKTFYLAFCFAICLNAGAQESAVYKPQLNLTKPKLFQKKDIAPLTLCFVSGMASGFNDAIWAHNPYAGNQFFDPYISWENKYTSRVPLAKSVMAFTTDANHLSRFVSDVSFVTAIGLSFNDLKGLTKKQRRWRCLERIGISFLANKLGHTLVYGVIY